jgi:hypothetical protein
VTGNGTIHASIFRMFVVPAREIAARTMEVRDATSPTWKSAYAPRIPRAARWHGMRAVLLRHRVPVGPRAVETPFVRAMRTACCARMIAEIAAGAAAWVMKGWGVRTSQSRHVSALSIPNAARRNGPPNALRRLISVVRVETRVAVSTCPRAVHSRKLNRVSVRWMRRVAPFPGIRTVRIWPRMSVSDVAGMGSAMRRKTVPSARLIVDVPTMRRVLMGSARPIVEMANAMRTRTVSHALWIAERARVPAASPMRRLPARTA